jgi:hypothetical protein
LDRWNQDEHVRAGEGLGLRSSAIEASLQRIDLLLQARQ